MKQLPLDFGWACTPRLDHFVPLGNEPAWDHLHQMVANPVRPAVPTYLWGEPGCGKTHLLRAVAAALREQGEPVGWLDARTPHPAPFDNAWQVVVLDDCDAFGPQHQAAAFNWFVNAQTPTEGRPRWVLAAGALPPTDLALRDDLRTRLGWGQVHHLLPLGEAQRLGVLRRAAQERGLHLTDEVMAYMVNRFSRDLSSLMQLLEHLDRYALGTQRAVTIPLIKSMLENE